ncbi:MAG: lysylphosphatidylglycerol synthase transmembrane domain-containing protein [Bacteroidia bacterium]
MEKKRKPGWNKYLKIAVKVVVSGLALYLVMNKLDTQQLWETIKGAQWWALFAALWMLFLSQVFSSIRFMIFLNAIGIRIGFLFNFRIYLTGMFYNLFLPGGIGGDGYKVILLKRQYRAGWKPLVKVAFHDRLNGLMLLLMMIAILIPFVSPDPVWGILALAAIPTGFLIYRLVMKRLFREVKSSLLKISVYSLVVQGLVLVSVFFILLALRIPWEAWPPYLLLFLVASIAAILPISFGGIGIREIVFYYGAVYFGTSEAEAISISLLFFAIAALLSLSGAFVQPKIKKEVKNLPGSLHTKEGTRIIE